MGSALPEAGFLRKQLSLEPDLQNTPQGANVPDPLQSYGQQLLCGAPDITLATASTAIPAQQELRGCFCLCLNSSMCMSVK